MPYTECKRMRTRASRATGVKGSRDYVWEDNKLHFDNIQIHR